MVHTFAVLQTCSVPHFSNMNPPQVLGCCAARVAHGPGCRPQHVRCRRSSGSPSRASNCYSGLEHHTCCSRRKDARWRQHRTLRRRRREEACIKGPDAAIRSARLRFSS
jgi:hypothetical protein